MITKQWENKVAHGYSIELSPGFFIKITYWDRHEFIEVNLVGPARYKGHLNILSGRLAYSENEIQRHIETCKDEFQNILERNVCV